MGTYLKYCILQVLPENVKMLEKDLANQSLKNKLGTGTKPPTEQGAEGGTEAMDEGKNIIVCSHLNI